MERRIATLIFMFLVLTAGFSEAGQEKQRPEAFRNELEKKGFIVQEGKLEFPDLASWCCQCQLPTCYAYNPSSPYGLFVLPPAPNQNSLIKNPYSEWFYEDGHYPEGWSWFWRQRADEAVVFIGTTPPAMKYFGFTGYLYDRYRESITPPDCITSGGGTRVSPDSVKNRFPLFASLGDTVNNMVVNVIGGKKDPFNKTVVFIMATDQDIEREIRRTLMKAGYPYPVINTIVVSPSIVRLGVESESDTLAFVLRMASEKTQELQEYMGSSMSLFRVSPAQPVPLSAIEPLALPNLRVRGTGETEISLLPAVDALGEAIVASYPEYDSVKIATVNWYEGYNCIENGQNCLADNRDTPYIPPVFNPLTQTLLQDMILRPNEFYVAYGVNHQETRKATYSNVSILGWRHKSSPALLTSDDMPGSAQYYIGSSMDQATTDKLYAWKVTRPEGCKAGEVAGNIPPNCKEVGYTCQDGIAADDPMLLVFRAYLEPKTRAGAAYGEIIIDRIIKFKPKP
jgi:hypothetical protein